MAVILGAILSILIDITITLCNNDDNEITTTLCDIDFHIGFWQTIFAIKNIHLSAKK